MINPIITECVEKLFAQKGNLMMHILVQSNDKQNIICSEGRPSDAYSCSVE